jgi:hypothetical protein
MKYLFLIALLALTAYGQSPTPPPPTNFHVDPVFEADGSVDPYKVHFHVDPKVGTQVGFQAWRAQMPTEVFHNINSGYPQGSFIDSVRLLPGTMWCYKSRAYDAQGQVSVFTDEVVFTTADGPMPNQQIPAPPINVAAVPQIGSIRVSWTNGYFIPEPDGTGMIFYIYRSTDLVTWRYLNNFVLHSLTDITVISGTTYYYRVRAQNPFLWGGNVFSDWSEIVSATAL